MVEDDKWLFSSILCLNFSKILCKYMFLDSKNMLDLKYYYKDLDVNTDDYYWDTGDIDPVRYDSVDYQKGTGIRVIPEDFDLGFKFNILFMVA